MQVKFNLELDDDVHASLKARAKASLRNIPDQLLYEALQFASRASRPTIPKSRCAKKKGSQK